MEITPMKSGERLVQFLMLLLIVFAIDHFFSEKWATYFLLALVVVNLVRIKMCLIYKREAGELPTE